jgi:hypothetical protein
MNIRDEKLDIFRGLAMLWVIFNHTTYWLNFFSNTQCLSVTKSLLLIGTQLFFFIAGASNGMSRRKNILKFYSIRFKRVLLPYWIYAIICIIIFLLSKNITASSEFSYYIKSALYNWFIALNHQWASHGMLTWALWFIPVYLSVMLLFPFLRKFYEKFTSSKIRMIPLIVFALLVFLFQYDIGMGDNILRHCRMAAFYGFFAYLGLFFTEIFKKKHTKIAIVLLFVCISATILSILFLHQSPNMQTNKFPPNFLFLIYTMGALTILYIFSDSFVKTITSFRKNKVFNWFYSQYIKHGITIFLFHPFVFILLEWLKNLFFLEWLKKTGFATTNQIIVLTVLLFLSFTLSAIIGNIFSWVERIKIFKYERKNII